MDEAQKIELRYKVRDRIHDWIMKNYSEPVEKFFGFVKSLNTKKIWVTMKQDESQKERYVIFAGFNEDESYKESISWDLLIE